jgi:hypothetical protein
MTGELERRLVALGAELELPPAPDLVPAVLARLPARRPRVRSMRRAVAAVVAATLLLAGLAMAAPPTRHAILRILGLEGVTIERVPHLPPLPARGERGLRLGLGEHIPLARARHAATFTALLPPGSPAAYLNHDVPGGRISLLTDGVLIIEFRGTALPFIFKLIGPGTSVRRVRVNGDPGVYLSGRPHEVLFEAKTGQFQTERVRLAGNVLLWQRGPLTIRVEGTRTLRGALAIARSLR